MTERIVVAFWMQHAGLFPTTGRGFLQRARALTQRGEALGASLVAVGGQSCAFALEPEAVEEAVTLATSVVDEPRAGELAWACAISQGEMEVFWTEGGPLAARALQHRNEWALAWGEPLVRTTSLARIADAGDVLVDDALKERSALVTVGVRVGREHGSRLRGARLDVKQPWRAVAAAQVSRMKAPPLIGREDPSSLLWMPGALAVLRADPGLGGTRLLLELQLLVEPAPCLVVFPSGSGLEPLGALRRALGRAGAQGRHVGSELEPALARLLSGDGVPLETAAALVVSFLQPPQKSVPPGALLIDDGADIDAATLEACARAVVVSERAFPCVVRVAETSAPPQPLQVLPKGPEMDLKPLASEDAEALAAAALGAQVEPEVSKRWARRGGYTPLGILEAIAASLSSGELSWSDAAVHPTRRSAGRGKPRASREWIARRAEMMSSKIEQLVVAIVALLGGDASSERIERVLEAAHVQASARQEAENLVQRRWLVALNEGWYALPTRSHREAILSELTDEGLRSLIHRAIARVLEAEERGLGLAEAAHHLACAGDHTVAAKMALGVARAASALELGPAVMRLVSFAREHDPSSEDEARAAGLPTHDTLHSATESEEVAETVEVPFADSQGVVAAPKVSSPAHDSEPPTIAVVGNLGITAMMSANMALSAPAMPEDEAPASEPGTILGIGVPGGNGTANVREPVGEPATPASLGVDTRALERWTGDLCASGAQGRFAERMQAIVRLSRGDVGEALRVLRTARAELDVRTPSAERCQASLALGMALAVAGRADEALLEALDALARAKEGGDEKGAHACLAFLAKLYASVERAGDAVRLRKFANVPEVVSS